MLIRINVQDVMHVDLCMSEPLLSSLVDLC